MEHKLISGGEQWLPFARSRIKALRATGLQYVTQKYEIGGVFIEVQIVGEHEYVRINGGGEAVYEFFVTGPQLNPNVDSSSPAASRLNPEGSAVRLILRGESLVAVPLWSSIHEDTETEKRWKFTDRGWWSKNHIRISGAAYVDNFTSAVSHPSEHFGSYHHYTKDDELVSSCRPWGPGSPIIPTYKVDGEFNVSHAMWGVESNVFYSFGTLPEYLAPKDRPLGTVWYDRVLFQHGANDGSYSNGYMNPFGWVDTRKNKPPQFVTYVGPPANVTFTPPNAGSIVYNTWGYSEPVSDAVQGVRRQPECNRENYAPNTFDIPPAYYTKDATLVGAGKVNPNVHWRSAAVQEVTAPDARKVKVVILTDTHNGFMFYEARDYVNELPPLDPNEFDSWVSSPSYRNIPQDRRIRVKPAMPAWATVPDDAEPYKARTWLWRFNRDGTKAVSTPSEVVDRKIWAKVWPWQEGDRSVDLYLVKPELNTTPSGLVELPLYSIPELTPDLASAIAARAEDLAGDFSPRSYNVHFGQGHGTYFFELEGVLHPFYGHTILTDVHGYDDIVRDHVVAVQEITPGLVEVSISINVSYASDGALTIDPSVEVVRSDHYSLSGKMYADAAYYVKTLRARTGGGANIVNLPDDDDLIAADIALRSRSVPNIGVEAYVYYRVRNLRAGNVAASLCLGAGLLLSRTSVWAWADTLWPKAYQPNVNGIGGRRLGVLFYAVLLAHDLRYLSFLTASYHRRSIMPNDLIQSEVGGAAFAARGNVLPRICLRIPGEPTKIVNYSKSAWDGDYPSDTTAAHKNYGPNNYGVDPMANIGLDYQPSHGGFPELNDGYTMTVGGTAVSTDKEVREMHQRLLCFVTPGQYYMTFSFTPKGDYAVYFDARSSQFTPTGNTTESSGVIDVIKIGKKKTSHKAVFNAAFRTDLGYDYFPIDQEAPSASGRFGMNGIFMYKVPLGLSQGSQVTVKE